MYVQVLIEKLFVCTRLILIFLLKMIYVKLFVRVNILIITVFRFI